MPVQVYEPEERDIHKVWKRFAIEVAEALDANFDTQAIWPNEIYPGFAKVNALRKQRHQWFATGAGAQSIEVNQSGDTISIAYNDYLRFAEMGVGRFRPYAKVQHSRKARHSKRYVTMWMASAGKSHRPAIMMEARHLQSRMENYYADFLGKRVPTYLVHTIQNAAENPIHI